MFGFEGTNTKRGTKVINNLYYFSENQMLDCNQFAIINENSEEIALFDAGNGRSLKGLFNGMKKLGLNPENITKIFLTHEHVDHVLGLYPLMEYLKEDPPKIYAHGETARILTQGDENKIFPGGLGITAHMFGVKIRPLMVTKLMDGDFITLNQEFKFKVLHAPGHSLGSVCYYFPEQKVLIPGDVVFTGGSFGRFDFPGGSLQQLIKSISMLTTLDVVYLLPGHMGISDNGNQQIQYSYRMIQSSAGFF